MRLAWATDIHLNFVPVAEALEFARSVEASAADRIVISGDIAEAPSFADALRLMESVTTVPIDFVLGNHDFYHSSVAEVRAEAVALSRASPRLRWLPDAGVVSLSDESALIGHDGWADGRLGDYAGSTIKLTDFRLIRDLAGLDADARLVRMQALADEAAAFALDALEAAFADHRRVLFATHVPPFRESCWFQGRLSDDNWLPHFTCKALGDVLRASVEGRPDRSLTVLCGHTHGEGRAQILPNLEVFTGGATYRQPAWQGVFDLP